MKKKNVSVNHARHYLEPGPVVLVSSSHKGQINIMTMGWHMMMGTDPSTVACYIWDQDHSYKMIRKSKECVLNIPSVDLAKQVVGVGNSSGRDIDKFKTFDFTPGKAKHVSAPLINECFANLECKLVDTKLIKKYSIFIFEVVKIHASTSVKTPKTIHYKGRGEFMVAGADLNLAKLFKPEMLRE